MRDSVVWSKDLGSCASFIGRKLRLSTTRMLRSFGTAVMDMIEDDLEDDFVLDAISDEMVYQEVAAITVHPQCAGWNSH